MSQFGWFFAGFGMIFVWVFMPAADFTSMIRFRGELETRTATVTQVEETSYSEGGSDTSDGTPIYAVHYAFTTPDEREHRGVSYEVGGGRSVGGTVTIEHPKGQLDLSRIKGMRARPMSPLAALVLIFPAVGVAFLIPGFRRGIKGVRLLRSGTLGRGVLKSKKGTRTKINEKTVFKLTFAFEAEDGSVHEVMTKTHEPAKLEDDVEEPLLYDPLDPSYAVMLDNLPGRPAIGEDGTVRATGAGSLVMTMLVPTAAIVGHGVWAILNF